MELFVFLGTLFFLLFTGLPIAIVLMLCSIVLLKWTGLADPMILSQQMIGGIDNFVLTTIPFFILAGEIMQHGGISERLLRFAELVVGRLRGGLGYVAILASILFAGLSGVAVADVSALGSMLIPLMVAKGYSRERATGIICSASLTSPIIPPSMPLIILGVTVELSIGRLFMAGIVPGLILGASLMVAWFFVAKHDGIQDTKIVPRSEYGTIIFQALPALILPVIIIVGIRMGIFTPTEGGAVAAVYAFVVSRFLFGQLPWSKMPEILFQAAQSTAVVIFIISSAYCVGWLITVAQVPRQVITLFSGLIGSPILLLLSINLLLLLLGMVMDLTPLILIFAPVIFPLIKAAHINPYYFAIVMVLNLCIGLLTPPVGTVLYIGASVAKVSLGQVVRGVAPFLVVEAGVLLLFIFFPALILVPLSWFY
jgi:tripartite ATP-independent transporter DctM subunit